MPVPNGTHSQEECLFIYVRPYSTVPGTISLSGNLDFGNVAVGSAVRRTLTIANTGNAAVTVSGISYPAGFSGAWSGTIPKAGSQPVTVTFVPSLAIHYTDKLTVNSDATGVNTWPVSGTGVPYTFTTLAGMVGTARFHSPYGVAVDSAGNVYVADTWNNTIRKITLDGTVTTLAGVPEVWGSANGKGSAARFANPFGVAVDSAGNVYVADTFNHTIRKVTPDGTVTTLAGSAGCPGSANGNGSAARFHNPYGVAVDGAGNVYVADTWNNTIRKVTPDGTVTTLAGVAEVWGSANGKGSAALFGNPFGVAVDSAGTIYVADTGNQTIRKVTSDGTVTTVAGLAGGRGSMDGTGSAARFFNPFGVAVDSVGTLYVADTGNGMIRKGSPGAVSLTAPTANEPTYPIADNARLMMEEFRTPRTTVSLSGSDLNVSLQTEPGVTYTLEATDDLVNPHWTPVQSIIGDGHVMNLIDPNTNEPMRFYRVKVE